MKKQEILEILVANPLAVFVNTNREAGKYSQYPPQFQVVGISHDSSCVYVKSVNVRTVDYLRGDDGEWLRDEDNRVITDTRTIAERTEVTYGKTKSMPTRLILKSDMTVQEMVEKYITEEEARVQELKQRQANCDTAEVAVKELEELFTTLGITDTGGGFVNYYGRTTCQFDSENITRLVAVLKSALVEVEV